MAIVQLNIQIKKDFAIDYYTMIKFCEEECNKLNGISFHHLEINAGYAIYNLYTLYSVTPCIKSSLSSNPDNPVYTSSLLVLIDNNSKKILHCAEIDKSIIDIDKYFEIILNNYCKINQDYKEYFKAFITKNIIQKNKDNEKENITNITEIMSDNDSQPLCPINENMHNENVSGFSFDCCDHPYQMKVNTDYTKVTGFSNPLFTSPQETTTTVGSDKKKKK